MSHRAGSDSKIDLNSIRVRRARAADYDAVVDINTNVYEGFDYLPALYHNFLHNPNVYMYVAEYRGQIAQFAAAYFSQDMRTMTSLGARVRPEHQNKGLMNTAQRLLQQQLHHAVRKPFHQTSAAYYNPLVYPPHGKLTGLCRVYRSWHAISYVLPPEALGALKSQGSTNGVHSFSQDSSCTTDVHRFGLDTTLSLLRQPSTLQLLQRDGDYIACFNYWLILKVSYENLEFLAKTCPATQFSLQDGQTTAISFCSQLVNRDHTLRCDIFYYGAKDETTWASHVLSYLSYLTTVSPTVRKYRVMLHFPVDICVETAEQKLLPALGKRFVGEFNKEPRSVLIGYIKPAPHAKL